MTCIGNFLIRIKNDCFHTVCPYEKPNTLIRQYGISSYQVQQAYSVLARSKRAREISALLLFAACLTLFTRYRRAKLARARVEEQHSCVQPKPTRSTPIAKDVDAAFDRAINAINADNLKRYALFDAVSRGGTQRADG